MGHEILLIETGPILAAVLSYLSTDDVIHLASSNRQLRSAVESSLAFVRQHILGASCIVDTATPGVLNIHPQLSSLSETSRYSSVLFAMMDKLVRIRYGDLLFGLYILGCIRGRSLTI